MKKIKCTLGTLHKAIAEIESYQKELDEKVHTLMERLAEIGIEEATVRFANAIYDGTNDVRVNNTPVWIDKNKLAISATGKSITFIEFGAGVHYAAESHPKAGDFGFTRGGYGYHLGKLDSWRYSGNPGTMVRSSLRASIKAKSKHTVIRQTGRYMIPLRKCESK